MAPNVDAAVAQQNSQIQQLYDALANDLGAGVTATKGIYSDASSGVGGAYDQGMGALDATMQNLSARIGKSAQMLGLSDAAPSALSVLQGNLAANQSGMIGNKTADLAALANEGAAYEAVGQRSIGDARATGAKTQVDAASKLKAAMFEMMGQEEQAKSQVELQGLKNQSALDQLRMELEGKNAEQQYNLKLAELEGQGDPLDALRAQKMALEIEEMMNGGAGGGEFPDFGRGQVGVEAFDQYGGFNGDDGARNYFDNLQRRAVEEAMTRKDQGTAGDPYFLAQNILNSDAQVNDGRVGLDDLDAIRMALDIFYGKYGAPKF